MTLDKFKQDCELAMVNSKPCKRCPFKKGGLPYTDEGQEALDAGKEPACHEHTEAGMQFDDPMPSEAIACNGFALWMNGDANYFRPKTMYAA